MYLPQKLYLLGIWQNIDYLLKVAFWTTHSVSLNSTKSGSIVSVFEVPQGSVLGQLGLYFFTIDLS